MQRTRKVRSRQNAYCSDQARFALNSTPNFAKVSPTSSTPVSTIDLEANYPSIVCSNPKEPTMNINDIKPAKILRTYFEIIVVTTKGRSPFAIEAQTLAEARALAEKKAPVQNVPIIELGWKEAFPPDATPGVYICAIMRDLTQPCQPRVFA
jgi:hypothetical protein